MDTYSLKYLHPNIVLIEEDGILYRATQVSLLEDIQNLKENRRAYLNEEYFEHTLKILEDALKLLKEEGALDD